MLNNIINYSIKNKLIVSIAVLFLIGIGIVQTQKLPIDAVPDITNNQVLVITQAPAFGATDIERLITTPVEQACSNIPGRTEIRSFSRFGLSLVTIVFSDETDVYWARAQVTERLIQIKDQIPESIGKPELGPVSTGLGEIYQYVIRPKKGYENQYPLTELRRIQDWTIRRQLLGVQGVAEVSSFGGKLKQYEIAINTQKLNARNLTIGDVYETLAQNNENTGGTYIEKGPTALFIRTEGLLQNITEIENLTIKKDGMELPLFLRDIAEVKIGAATRYGAITYNDQGETCGAIVMMLKGENSGEVIKNVKLRIAEIQKTLPDGLIIESFLDRTKMVNNAINTVTTNLLEGALIVLFILILFLGSIRGGIIVASVIPLSLLFAICMMNLFGVSGNLMSLGALDFGLIIDGAVIIIEAVLHKIQKLKVNQKLTQADMDRQTFESTSSMMNSAVFGQIIILIVYLPLLMLQGIEGKMFIPMAQTIAFALLGAFILSLTYVPMVSSLFLNIPHIKEAQWHLNLWLSIEKYYELSFAKIYKNAKLIFMAAVVLFAVSIFVFTKLGGEFIPELEEGDFAVDTRVLTGSNLNTSIEYSTAACKLLLKQYPEIEKIVTKIGSGEVPTDPMPMDAADMMIILKDKSEWTSANDFDELSQKMSKTLEAVPGVTFGFQYPVQMRFNELMTGARQDVICKIFGENLDSLSHLAQSIGTIAESIPGAEDVYIEPITGVDQIIIDYKRPLLSQYGLSVKEVNQVINTAMAGQVAGQIYEGSERYDLVLKLDQNLRQRVEEIKNLLVTTPKGSIPLNQIAHIKIEAGPNQIQHDDARRRIIVGFNINTESDIKTAVEALKAKIEQKVKLPTGYFLKYGGSFENLEKATSRLFITIPLALGLIFLLLYLAFKSVKLSLLIFSAIPLAAIGGIWALVVRGMPFSISAGVGFIALFGVAVLNGIVLVSEFEYTKFKDKLSLFEIVKQGTMRRLKPVLLTAFVASFGFLPMALSQSSGAEVQRPLATVVIGGLITATFLTLYILPILYLRFYKKTNEK